MDERLVPIEAAHAAEPNRVRAEQSAVRAKWAELMELPPVPSVAAGAPARMVSIGVAYGYEQLVPA